MISNVSSSKSTPIVAHNNQKDLKPQAKQSKDIITDNGKLTAGAQEPKNISATQTATTSLQSKGTPKNSIDMKA